MQISPSYIHNFTARNTEEWRKWYPVEVSHIGIHKTHVYYTPSTFQLPQFTPGVMSHTHPPMVLITSSPTSDNPPSITLQKLTSCNLYNVHFHRQTSGLFPGQHHIYFIFMYFLIT